MSLQELVNGISLEQGTEPDDFEINGISTDTRTMSPGDLFVARSGVETDGHKYIDDALDKGAAALLIDGDKSHYLPEKLNAPVLTVNSPREDLPGLLRSFYGDVDRDLTLVGITGTNGKTTTTHLVESILLAEGESVGLIGTIERRFDGTSEELECTTPSLTDIYRYLSEWSERGATSAVMEVSSHALDQGRVRGLSFAAAGFTNLSQDHLDYHEDMEAYFQAKGKLFQQAKRSVVYLADEYCRRLAEQTGGVTVGADGDYRVLDKDSDLSGTEVTLELPSNKKLRLQSPLTGLHNYKNVALAAGIAGELGVEPENIKRGVENCEAVPGRCERVSGEPAVIVDYAHTPSAVENVIESLKPLCEGQLICVFGAGGDRDRGKRPAMGEAAARLADYSVVTSDNPRSEQPQEIINDILVGMEEGRYHVQVDRGQAIREAVQRAAPGDLVLVLGKGHETEQVIGDRVVPFNDARVTREVLQTVG